MNLIRLVLKLSIPTLLAASVAALYAQPIAPAASGNSGSSQQYSSECEDTSISLSKRAFSVTRRINEYNRDAIDHTEKYKVELATCKIATESKIKAQLEACLSLLKQSQAREDKVVQTASVLAKDLEVLQLDAMTHNQRCPMQQIKIIGR